jgi:hypothetical protein
MPLRNTKGISAKKTTEIHPRTRAPSPLPLSLSPGGRGKGEGGISIFSDKKGPRLPRIARIIPNPKALAMAAGANSWNPVMTGLLSE